MDTVKVFAPVVEKFLSTKDGLSITQANSKKNENTNEAETMLEKFSHPFYNQSFIVVGSGGAVHQDVTVPKLSISDFDDLDTVADLYSTNAVLGHAINLFKTVQAEIETMPESKIMELFGIEVPQFSAIHPTAKRIINMPLDRFVELETIEDMVRQLGKEALDKIDTKTILNALALEARAAVYGKQLTKKESYLKQVLAAVKEKILGTKETAFGLVINKIELVYNDVEIAQFKILRENLYKHYTSIQGQVNGVKKLIKDTVRQMVQDDLECYKAELSEYNKQLSAYNQAVSEAEAQAEALRNKALTELASLKILS